MLWTIPGFALKNTNPNSTIPPAIAYANNELFDENNEHYYNIDSNQCLFDCSGVCFDNPGTPCSPTSTSPCVATNCGKTNWKIPDVTKKSVPRDTGCDQCVVHDFTMPLTPVFHYSPNKPNTQGINYYPCDSSTKKLNFCQTQGSLSS